MDYPYYRVINKNEYDYIRASLDSFGYDVYLMPEEYVKDRNCIVLDSNGKFGRCNNLPNEDYVKEKRYVIDDIELFLYKAKKLLEDKEKQIKPHIISIKEIKKAFNIKSEEELIIID